MNKRLLLETMLVNHCCYCITLQKDLINKNKVFETHETRYSLHVCIFFAVHILDVANHYDKSYTYQTCFYLIYYTQ